MTEKIMTENTKLEERVTIRFKGHVLRAILELRIKREREIGKPTSMTRVVNDLVMDAYRRDIVKEKEK